MPNTPRASLFIRLTHSGLYSDGRPNTSPVQIPDLDVGYENQNRKVPVYVPAGGHIDINASSRSMLSFEQGGILKFTNAGLIESQMFYVPESFTTLDLPDPSHYPVGTFVWNSTENAAYWSNGTTWIAGGGGGGGGGVVTVTELGEVEAPNGPYPSIQEGYPTALSGGNLIAADAASFATAPVIGFYTGITTNRVRTDGLFTGIAGVTFTPGADLWLAVGGGFTETPPNGVGQVSQYLGQAVTTNSFYAALELAVEL